MKVSKFQGIGFNLGDMKWILKPEKKKKKI